MNNSLQLTLTSATAVPCCLLRAVDEEMKRAATYAIAALAKRPVMKRRSPSAGDLIHIATAADKAAAAAQQHTEQQQAGAVANGSTTSSALSTDISGHAAVSDGAASSTASGSTSQQQQQQGPADTPAAAAAAAGGRSGSPSKGHHRHTGSGTRQHMRRKSYGEGSFYTVAEGEGGNAAVVFGKQ
jgi:hypothetical protein